MNWHNLYFEEMQEMTTEERLKNYDKELKSIYEKLVKSKSTLEIRKLKEEAKSLNEKKKTLLKQLGRA